MSNSSKMPHGFARFIIGDGSAVSEQKNIIWNMIGSFLYAFASMVLSIAVVQLAGEDAGGVFTFAFTTFGQHMFMAAYFGIRPFQITDTGEKYTFGDYLGLRLITCGLAILVGFGYVMVSGYTDGGLQGHRCSGRYIRGGIPARRKTVSDRKIQCIPDDPLRGMFPRKSRTDGRTSDGQYLGGGRTDRRLSPVRCPCDPGTPECDMEVGARKEIPALPG